MELTKVYLGVKQGKTRLAIDTVARALEEDKKVLFISSETPPECVYELLGNVSNMSNLKVLLTNGFETAIEANKNAYNLIVVDQLYRDVEVDNFVDFESLADVFLLVNVPREDKRNNTAVTTMRVYNGDI